MSRELLGAGRVARVYRDGPVVEKVFRPSLMARFGNLVFFGSWTYPFSTSEGRDVAFAKRELSSLAADVHREQNGENIYIPSVIKQTKRGFIMPFIDGSPAEERTAGLDGLENYFEENGLPTWSFSRHNPHWNENVLSDSSGLHIVDVESSMPSYNNGRFGYDPFDCDLLCEWLDCNKAELDGNYDQAMVYFDTIAREEVVPTKLGEFKQAFSRESLESELEQMLSEDRIDEDKYQQGIGFLEDDKFNYIMKQYGVHVSIFFGTMPLESIPGSSSIPRFLYTAVSHAYHKLVTGEREKAHIHRPEIALLSLCPYGPGTFLPYLVAMYDESPTVSYACARIGYRQFADRVLEEDLPVDDFREKYPSVVYNLFRVPQIPA